MRKDNSKMRKPSLPYIRVASFATLRHMAVSETLLVQLTWLVICLGDIYFLFHDSDLPFLLHCSRSSFS
jgi:hypothetical protein